MRVEGHRSKTKPPLVISSEKRKRARLAFDESPNKRSKRSQSQSEGSGRDTRSPEPNCPICLGRVEGKCYAHGCFHSFCKTCLSEWAKVKPECPVCREPFDKIIYNVRALDMYDEVAVPPRPSPAASLFGHGFLNMGPYINHFNELFHHHLIHHHEAFTLPPAAHSSAPRANAAAAPSFTATASSTYRNPHTLPTSPSISLNSISIQIDADSNSSFVVRGGPRRTSRRIGTASSASELGLGVSVEDMFRPMLQLNPVPPRPGSVEFRRHIYRSDLWVKYQYRDTRSRECSAHFYRSNVAVTFRLHDFIRRDLRAIIRSAHEVSLVQQMIVTALTEHDIRSRPFRRIIENYTLTNTEHFIHELYCFAVSPIETMESYDQRSEYVSKRATMVQSTMPAVPPIGFMYENEETIETTAPLRRRLPVECITISSEDESDDDQLFAPVRPSAPASATVTSTNAQNDAYAEISFGADEIEVLDLFNANEQRVIEEAVEDGDHGVNLSVNLNVNYIDDFNNPAPGPSGINTSIVLPINLTQDLDSDSDTDIDVGQDANSAAGRFGRREPAHFADDEDDADDIEVVGVVKPRHERTPEVLDLCDDEDESFFDNQKKEVDSLIVGLKAEKVEKAELGAEVATDAGAAPDTSSQMTVNSEQQEVENNADEPFVQEEEAAAAPDEESAVTGVTDRTAR